MLYNRSRAAMRGDRAVPGARHATCRRSTGTVSAPEEINIGIIGLDTSHAIAFTQLLNSEASPAAAKGCRIVAAYPFGSRDIVSSRSRIPLYTQQVQKLGVEVVGSVDALVDRVDAVLLETNDGRLHLEQALAVFATRKPVFIDKPIAASLADVIAIFAAADHYRAPVFSASSLRFGKNAIAVRDGAIGKVNGCDTFSPCDLEPAHADLFWYGVHGVESLFTVMKPGCKQVYRIHAPDADIVVGEWIDGRLGTFRGMRVGNHNYGGIAFGAKGNQTLNENPGYEQLLLEIVRFFRTGVPPVSPEETIEIYAFMEAADESRRSDGAAVTIESVLDVARKAAAEKRSW